MMGAPRRRSSASSQPEPGSSAWVADAVQQYTDLIYSAAARRVADPHVAEDITQAVFLVLAKQPHKAARSANRSGSLVPWLLKTTRYAAANALKRERRRIYHEQRAARAQGESAMTPHPSSLAAALTGGAIASSDPSEVLAWREIAPLLDDAILALSGGDRTAIVMRYYEGRSTAEIASALGIRQDAVRQRLSRAVEKLRRKLESKGASSSAAVLAGLLGAHVVKAAPAHLAGACLSAISGGAAASASVAAIAKGAMAMSYTLKATAGTVVLAGGMVAGVIALAGGEGEAAAAKPSAPPAIASPLFAPSQPTTKPMTAAEIQERELRLLDRALVRNEAAAAAFQDISYKVTRTDRTPDGRERKVCDAQVWQRGNDFRAELQWAANDQRDEYKTYILANSDYLIYWAPASVNAHEHPAIDGGYDQNGTTYLGLARQFLVPLKLCGNGRESLRQYRDRLGANWDWTASEGANGTTTEVTLRNGERYQTFTLDHQKGSVVSQGISGTGEIIRFRDFAVLGQIQPDIWFPAVMTREQFDTAGNLEEARLLLITDVKLKPDLSGNFFRRDGLPIPDGNHVIIYNRDGTFDSLIRRNGAFVSPDFWKKVPRDG